MLKLDESERPLAEEDLLAMERDVGTLPREFLDFYLANNGGYPEANRVEGVESVFTINGFNPIKYGKLTVDKLAGEMWKDFPVLEGMLPFAFDDGGDSFLLSLNDKAWGKVYIWNMDQKELILVSNSFHEFLSSMYLDE